MKFMLLILFPLTSFAGYLIEPPTPLMTTYLISPKAGNFEETQLAVKGAFPIQRKLLFGSYGFGSETLQYSEFPRNLVLTQFKLGGTFYTLTEDDELIILSLQTSATQESSLSPLFEYSLWGFFHNSVNERSSFLYGAGLFTELDGLFLPVLGYSYDTSKSSRFSILFPSHIEYSWWGRGSKYKLFMKYVAKRIGLSDVRITGEPLIEKPILRLTENHIGASGDWVISKNIKAGVEGGVITQKHLELIRGSQAYFTNTKFDTAYYIQFNLTYKLSPAFTVEPIYF